MTETKGDYNTGGITTEYILCGKCRQPIGRVVNIGGVDLLAIGGLLVRALHGAHECGEQFHWISEDRILQRLITKNDIS